MKQTKEVIEKEVIELVAIVVSAFVLGMFTYSVFNVGEIENSVLRYSLNPAGIIFLTGFLDSFPNFVSSFFVMISAISAGLNLHFVIFYAILGSLLGSVFGFFIGKRYLFNVVKIFFKKKNIDKTIEGINRYGRAFLLLAAIFPLPYLPMVFGAFGFRWKEFILWGIIPRVLAFVVYGYGFWLLII
jgi:membrane protein YqaA with SNARE-associated domain